MNDGNTSRTYECRVFDRGHVMQLDMGQTTKERTVYSCSCGEFIEEYEDCCGGA